MSTTMNETAANDLLNRPDFVAFKALAKLAMPARPSSWTGGRKCPGRSTRPG
jgi:hypothetical protein